MGSFVIRSRLRATHPVAQPATGFEPSRAAAGGRSGGVHAHPGGEASYTSGAELRL